MIGTLIKARQTYLRDSLLRKYPNIFFWLSFITLNLLIFLPAYLFNIESNSFLPRANIVSQGAREVIRELFVWRNNLDLFRLSAEFTFLMVLWIIFPLQKTPRLRKGLRFFTGGLFIAIFLYEVYESLSIYIYQVDAVFYAHYQLLIDGLGFLIEHLQISWVMILMMAVAVLAWLGFLIMLIRIITHLPAVGLNAITKTILVILLFFAVQALLLNRNLMVSPKSVVHSFSVKVQNNIANSIALSREVQALESIYLESTYDYEDHTLIATPNIFLVFVESYGSILYKREAFLEKYKTLLGQKEKELSEEGWNVASALSESPTWGGGSWLAYTSLLFGLRVDNHPQYLSMLEKYPGQEKSDFGYTMQKLGYRYIRATSLAVELDDQKWQEYFDFFGVDQWIRYRDLQYEGRHYGWGPSPPDQYTLSATHEIITEESERPFLLFLITQNSHYPWRKVPQIVQDWRSLNDGNAVVDVFEDNEMSRSERQENYFNAIAYELDFLTNFILNEADEDDIFILIGDHQPGYVTRRDDGFETPVHIISKDANFIQSFSGFGFDQGMEVQEIEAAIKHEGFYSLFMQIFLQHYGVGINVIPPYLPDGILLETK